MDGFINNVMCLSDRSGSSFPARLSSTRISYECYWNTPMPHSLVRIIKLLPFYIGRKK